MNSKIKFMLTLTMVALVAAMFLQSCSKDEAILQPSPIPQAINLLSHFAFNGNMNDSIGVHSPSPNDVKFLTFGKDRFGIDGKAGSFNGTTTLVEIPNGDQYMIGPSLTVSFWIKAINDPLKGQFVIGLAAWQGFYFEIAGDWSWVKNPVRFQATSGIVGDDIWFTGDGQTKDNGDWQGVTFHKDVSSTGGVGNTYLANKWAQVVFTYDANTKLSTLYINGDKVKQHDFNLWPTGDPKKDITRVIYDGNMTGGGNKLALGFIQASGNPTVLLDWADATNPNNLHFRGLMDDVRIWKVALTIEEVSTLYTIEKQ